LTSVSEIASKIEYIDFGWLPDRLLIARIGRYPARAGIGTGRASRIATQNVGVCGNSVRDMAAPAS